MILHLIAKRVAKLQKQMPTDVSVVCLHYSTSYFCFCTDIRWPCVPHCTQRSMVPIRRLSPLPSPLSPLSHHEKRGKKAGTNQKTNESTNEPTNQPTNGIEPIKRTNEPTNQPTNRITPNPTEPKQTKFNHATHQIASNQTNQPTNKQINE